MRVGSKVLFREGQTKAIGEVTLVTDKPLPSLRNRATEPPLSLFHDTVEIIVRHD